MAIPVGQAQNQLPPGTHDADSDTPRTVKDDARDQAEDRIQQKDFTGARPLLEKSLARNPSDARTLYDLGFVEDAGDHPDAAAADYRKAIAADPKQFEAHLALGLLLAHQSKFDEAREQLKIATNLTPNPSNPGIQAEAYRTLAKLDRASDPPAARDALVAALKLTRKRRPICS